MSRHTRFLVSLIIVLSVLTLFSVNPIYASTTVKPQLIWQRSTEAQNKVVQETVIGSKVNEALALPLDPNQTVFDNGVSTPTVNKNAVAGGISWASWAQYSSNGTTCGPIFDLRHFQAKFNLPSGFNPANVEKVSLKSPYYQGDTFPINDNAYIYINGNFVKRLGTSYGAANVGMHGTAPYANETDGWIVNGDLGAASAQFLHFGQNVIDIVAGEWCLWGGMGKLEFVLEGQFPTVPYFSQIDPIWGSQEYDSGNTLDLWCGSTIAQCGCAVTSAAMLLKYYGVDKSPTGEPTNPQTLNNWLKRRQFGFINGNTNWLEVAKYAKESHEVFGTPKVDYLGYVDDENFNILKDDLNSNRPAVLQVSSPSISMHFVVATATSGVTYLINDPISITNTSLQSYNGHFQTMRRYGLTNTDLSAILLTTPSPGEILIIDSLGRRLGVDPETGEVFNEIPNGSYYLQSPLTDDTLENPPPPPEGSGDYYIEILDPQEDIYTIQTEGESLNAIFLGYDQNADVSGGYFNIQGRQEFKLNYSLEPGSQTEVTQIIDIDIKPGNAKNVIELEEDDEDDEGGIKVAILTTPGFDANTVDVATVRFGPGQAQEKHNISKKNFEKQHFKDIDKDGDEDLVLHFRIKDTGIQIGDTKVCLTGKNKSGVSIEGCDFVKVVTDGDDEDDA